MAQANFPSAASRVSSQEEKVRELQRGLYTAAKRSGKRRFHALYDRLYQPVVLKEAWRRVKANRGAAGIDGVTLDTIERLGVGTFLEELRERLQSGTRDGRGTDSITPGTRSCPCTGFRGRSAIRGMRMPREEDHW